jgi:D-alanyl-D-alanine carboxypeptidase/D-alanyl-D-alanine-endopeptidase (penicillin-binding protein 4)
MMLRAASLLLALGCLASALPAGAHPPRPDSPAPIASRAPIVVPVAEGDEWSTDQIAALQRDLDALIVGAPALRGAHVGVQVLDTRSGTTLYSHNADEEFQPASTFKLVVGSAALDKLGRDFRFTTRAYLVDNAVLLRAGGDPSLSAADLDEFAYTVRAAGIKRIHGLAIDAGRYDRNPYAPGWTWDDFAFDYAAKASAMTLEENVVHLYLTPGALPGFPAKVSMQPQPLRIGGMARTLPRGAETTADVGHDPDGRLELTGGIALGTVSHSIDAAVPDPAGYALAVALAQLRARGVINAAPLVNRSKILLAKNARTIWTHASPPLAKLMPRFWIPSDNLYGELLLKEIGYVTGGSPGTTAKGIAYEKAWMRTFGIDPATMTLADGCGMSQYDRITPRDLGAILQHDWNGPYRQIVLDSLPVGGSRGTIEGIAGTAAAGRVFAKTGSMLHVRGLAGYLATERHGAVTFTFTVDDWNGAYPDLAALRASVLSRIIGD